MKKNKYIFYAILSLFLLLLIALFILSIKEFTLKYESKQNAKKVFKDISSPFTVNKIVYFSSANAIADINPNSSFTISNLYQYTDIAIFINNNSNRRI